MSRTVPAGNKPMAAHGRHPVRVPIKGKLDRGTPGGMLDVLRVRAMSEQDRDAAMTQIVSAFLWYLRTPKLGLEVAVDQALGVQRGADSGGQYKVVIDPPSTRSKLLFRVKSLDGKL